MKKNRPLVIYVDPATRAELERLAEALSVPLTTVAAGLLSRGLREFQEDVAPNKRST